MKPIPFILIIVKVALLFLLFSCSENQKKTSYQQNFISGNRVWYKQISVDRVAKVILQNENNGWAISKGQVESKGALYKYNGKLWSKITEFPFSVYPFVVQYNDSTLWYFIHNTVLGNDKPKHIQIKNGIHSEILLPEIKFDSTSFARFKSVQVLKNGTAWLVGSQGNILFFDRKKWNRIKSPVQREKDNLEYYDGDLTDIQMLNENLGFAVGVKGIIIKYKNGIWKKMDVPTNIKLNSIFMNNENSGWAVGLDGVILNYKNGKWSNFRSPSLANLKKVKFANNNRGWIAGLDNTFLEYYNNAWHKVTFNGQLKSHFWDFDFIETEDDKYEFWLAGNDGIYTTHNSFGISFSNITTKTSLREEGKAAHFFNANDDEYPDLIVQKDIGPPIFYISNNGVFEEQMLFEENDSRALAICSGDINNDGYTDIFLYSAYNNFTLLLGKGNGQFIDFTERSGIHFDKIPLAEISAKFVDLNNDGNLDLYFSANRVDDYLFVNNGTGIFENKFAESGIIKEIPHISYGAVFSDFNNDNLIDIFIIYISLANGRNADLFLNEGNFSFRRKEIPACRPNSSNYTNSAIADDFNNDGNIDLFIYNNRRSPQLLFNKGNAEFVDASKQMNFTEIVPYKMTSNGIMNFADVNNDGLNDLFIENKLLINNKNSAPTDISKFVGIDFTGNPSFTDYDNDGDYDLFIGKSSASFGKGVRAALYRNNLLDKSSVKLYLHTDESNRSAIGTKVTLFKNDSILFNQLVGLGNSPLVNSDISSLIIPVREKENRLEIIFPSGNKSVLNNISNAEELHIYESNFISHYLILFYKSLVRTHLLIDYKYEILKLFLFIFIVAFAFWKFKDESHFRYLSNPIFLFALLLIYLFSIHVFILYGFILYTTLSFIIPSLLGIVFIYISSEQIKKREAKYIAGYKILEIIGMGGMGKVFKAIDVNKKREVALKVLNPLVAKDEENKKRLTNEGKILSSFNHPNIVKVFEIGETEKHTYIAMEYLSGGTLFNMIKIKGRLSEVEAIHITLQICNAVEEIHNSGCIHRDLKSNNIMFDENDNIKIMDFGLSKTPLVSTMTTLGTIVGTLGYVAPEQITGVECDFRTDIFSLGIIIYEMVTGELPFTGENEIAVIHSIFNRVPKPPSEINILISDWMNNFILRMLEKEPENRFQTIKEIKKYLINNK